MPDDEVLDEVTSGAEGSTVDEMLDQFDSEIQEDERVENPKTISSECKGNILTECMRDGLEELERAAEETEVDYTVIGGIGTQLRGLADSGDILAIGDHFGRRQTADIDVLVYDAGDGIMLQGEYSEDGRPKLDAIYNHIPGDEDVIENSEPIYFGDIDERLDFTVSVPTNEDLIYTKVWHPDLEAREGTAYDLKRYEELNGQVFDVDEVRLGRIIRERAPNQEAALDYLNKVGLG